MTDEQIERIIDIVADEAWGIAAERCWALNDRLAIEALEGVCLAIEKLSHDPETCAKLVNRIKEMS